MTPSIRTKLDELKALAEAAPNGPDESYMLYQKLQPDDVVALVQAIETALADARREWQPIETAPKDGTHIIVLLDDPILFTTQETCWSHGCWQVPVLTNSIKPEYWIPLPLAPSGAPTKSPTPQNEGG